MKNILLIISFIILTLGCKKEEIEVVLEPTFELTLNGRDIDPVAFYRVINTYGGIKTQNGVTTKLFVLYLQRDEGNPRLDVEHFAVILKDTVAINNNTLLDVGIYNNPPTSPKSMNLEIPGNQDYVVYATATVADVHNGLICLEAEGEFWNPYQQAFYTVTAKIENYPIGQDIDATPYAYLID
jgi:hypothetical protein|tara:strand:- start:370 stop:918 length:549 start_codon:yes stop_codon:yes gene_type:complete